MADLKASDYFSFNRPDPSLQNMNSDHQKALKLHFPSLGSILVFTGSAFLSGVVGFWVGFYVWICSGQNPDNSGGTLIFFYGAIATGLLGLFLTPQPFEDVPLFLGELPEE